MLLAENVVVLDIHMGVVDGIAVLGNRMGVVDEIAVLGNRMGYGNILAHDLHMVVVVDSIRK